MKAATIRVTSVILVMFGLSVGVHSARSAAPAERLTADEALRLVRQINTAEATIFLVKDGDHQYRTLSQLLASPKAKSQVTALLNLTDESTGTVQGYTVQLLASPDSQHYSLGVTPDTSQGCGPAFFSSEAGIIYPAKALGCE